MALRLEDELLQAVVANDSRGVSELLAAGADANAGLFRGDFTALSAAVSNGSEEIVELLLQHGCNCCMTERVVEPESSGSAVSGSRVPDPDAARRSRHQWLKALKELGSRVLEVGAVSLARYTLRRVGWQNISRYRIIPLAAGHYLTYAIWAARFAFLRTDPLRQRYQQFTTYGVALFLISFPHRVWNAVTGRLSGDYAAASALGVRFPTFAMDLALSIPIRFATEVVVSHVKRVGTMWGYYGESADNLLNLIDTEFCQKWTPPGKVVLDAIFESKIDIERIVIRLLQADVLASKPYSKSLVALELCDLAIDRCWTQLLDFLVDNGAKAEGVPVRNLLETCKWPPLADAVAYAVPSANPLDFSEKAFEQVRAVQGGLRQPLWELLEPAGAFYRLMRSEKFQTLAVSGLPEDEATCVEMMYLLAQAGADPDAVYHGRNAAFHLVSLKQSPCSTKVLEHFLLLDRTPSPEEEQEEGEISRTMAKAMLLHEALNATQPVIEHVELLLRYGCDPGAENDEGRTPLHVAAYMNETTEAMKLSLEYGADPNDGGRTGSRPLVRALHDSSIEKFVFLLEHGADPEAKCEGKSILTKVVELDDNIVVLKYHLVRLLDLRYAVDVYEEDTNTSPALRAAVCQGNGPGYKEEILKILIKAIPEENLQEQLDDVLQFACKRDSDGSRRFNDGFTLFYLLYKGANPCVVQEGADTLLHILCESYAQSEHGHREDMKALLRRGVLDVNAPGNGGKRPLHVAVKSRRRDFVLLLLEYGVTVDTVDDDQNNPLHVLCSQNCPGHDISFTPAELEDSLHDPYYEGKRGGAALGFDSRRAHLEIKESLEQEEILQALLEAGADPMKQGAGGRNAFVMACVAGNSVLVAGILYWLGKSGGLQAQLEALSIRDSSNRSCLHLAAIKGYVRTVKVLLGISYLDRPRANEWRQKASTDEDGSNDEKNTEEEKKRQEDAYVQVHSSVPSFLQNRAMMWNGPLKSVRFSIGSERRRTDERIALPNVTVSDWDLSRSTVEKSWMTGHYEDKRGRTPLHYAAKNGHEKMVGLLLELTDVDLRGKDGEGRSAADLALEENHLDIYATLVELEQETRY
ncbi:ankyrin repeat-containing domain protein [Cercophora scortea]|uniref:Ankyrin repeat-containing domain protein n=1 Tax=Cercophora scortea TaxID=314031 RepID=A0AAE0M9N1_9PEZI|nr:ankyrin repeat-containing domain protein [Cercophora scortea]